MSRSRTHELTEALRKSTAVEARQAIELISTLLADARARLVNADSDALLRTQGEARALEKLYKQLTTTPPTQENT